MINYEHYLFRDMLATPDDDAPRLRVATEVFDAGHEAARAEFVRVQCELFRLADEIASGRGAPARLAPTITGLRARQKELLDKNEATWSAGARLPAVATVVYQRGFIHHLALDAMHPDIRSTLERVWVVAPTVRSVELRLHRRLQFGGGNLTEDVVRLLSPAVEHLAFTGDGCGDQVAATVAGSPLASRLKSLHFRDCGLGPAGVEALVRSGRLAGLRQLDLSGNDIRGSGFAALSASPRSFPVLERLRLSATGLRDEDAVALASVPGMGRLSELDIGDNPLSAAGVRALLGVEELRATAVLFDPDDLPSGPDRVAVEAALDRHSGVGWAVRR